MSATVVVPTFNRADLLGPLLASLASQTVSTQVLVVDNGSTDATPGVLARFPDVDVLRLPRNEGFGRAVNRGARAAGGDALVLVNNDCILDGTFVEAIGAALDPPKGIVMAAGVLRDWHDEDVIDTAGMELDETLLVFDYLNGCPLSVLDGPVADPAGPCGAAAAFDREAFLDVGGFDERLFAYWEDVDLVLRLRAEGGRCRLAPTARGVHRHSATLGSGSPAKNYLTGFGRGYVLRKWGVLGGARIPRVLVRDLVLCLGQAVVDGNAAGLRGRVAGLKAAGAAERRPYPAAALAAASGGTATRTLRRRAARRRRLRARERAA